MNDYGFESNEISEKSSGGTEISVRSLQSSLPQDLLKEFQIIPSRVREIDETKIRIYQQHDMAEDTEVSHLKRDSSRDRFHKLVFSSNWQLNDFINKLGIPCDKKVRVIETPITPLKLVEKPTDKINLIYFSTPHRGLSLLVPVFEELYKKYPNIHLNVFSSFKIYGWDNMDEQFEPLYDKVRNHPGMTYHGFCPNEELREHIQNSHILAYPCIWKETSCRVLIESMSAGLICVHPNLAALSDTAGGMTSMYQFQDDPNKHAHLFYGYLENAIKNVGIANNFLTFVKSYADIRFGIDRISAEWENLLRELLLEYPDVESRKIPQEMFVYRT